MPNLLLAFDENELAKWAQEYTVIAKESAAIKAGDIAKIKGHLDFEGFMTVAMWKSPRPMRFYKRNSDRVEGVTASAFAASHELERVLRLTELEGVNVRTATAILHLCHSEPHPLLDVWAMTSMGIERRVTENWDELDWLRVWPEYIRICRELRDRTGLDCRTIDRALWKYGERTGSKRSVRSSMRSENKQHG